VERLADLQVTVGRLLPHSRGKSLPTDCAGAPDAAIETRGRAHAGYLHVVGAAGVHRLMAALILLISAVKLWRRYALR
jgi:hypothetical protein